MKLKLKNEDPYIGAKKYVEELNKQEKEGNRKIIIKYSTNKIIDKNNNINFNVGYIFLEKLYYDLKLNETCKKISDEYRIKYDLNKILQDLIYTRIIEPCSKLSSFEVAKKFIEQPDYELHDIYRALEVIAKGTDFIESEVYKNSLNVINRNSKILYYDFTNYFFEIEQAEGYTSNEIIKTLREMKLIKSDEENYIPIYTRTDLTDELHDVFRFRTDYEITTDKNMKKILKNIKNKNIVQN